MDEDCWSNATIDLKNNIQFTELHRFFSHACFDGWVKGTIAFLYLFVSTTDSPNKTKFVSNELTDLRDVC